MEFTGSFHQVSFPDVMRTIEQNQRTGRLIIANGNLRAALYFSGGQYLLAERSGPGQLLAQQFVRSGLVTPEQIEAACSVSFAQAGSIPDVQLVRSLISSRTITQDQLRNWAVSDAVSLLSVVMGWVDGEFAFEDNVGIPAGRVALPMQVGPLMAQALRLVRTNGAPTKETPPLAAEAIIDFVEIDPDSGVAVQLTRDQWRLLTAVDGVSPLWAIIRALQAPEQTILRLAGELVANGVVMVIGRANPSAR